MCAATAAALQQSGMWRRGEKLFCACHRRGKRGECARLRPTAGQWRKEGRKERCFLYDQGGFCLVVGREMNYKAQEVSNPRQLPAVV